LNLRLSGLGSEGCFDLCKEGLGFLENLEDLDLNLNENYIKE
jgi:hypothetical protein